MIKYIAKIDNKSTTIWACNYDDARKKALLWAVSLGLSSAKIDIEEA